MRISNEDSTNSQSLCLKHSNIMINGQWGLGKLTTTTLPEDEAIETARVDCRNAFRIIFAELQKQPRSQKGAEIGAIDAGKGGRLLDSSFAVKDLRLDRGANWGSESGAKPASAVSGIPIISAFRKLWSR